MGILDKVRAFIIDTFLFGDDNGLQSDTSFIEGGIIDSTGVMELVAFLEQAFFVTIADDELVPDNLDSLAKVAAFVEMKTRYTQPSVVSTQAAMFG